MKLIDFVDKLNAAIEEDASLLDCDVFIGLDDGEWNTHIDVSCLAVQSNRDRLRKGARVVVLYV